MWVAGYTPVPSSVIVAHTIRREDQCAGHLGRMRREGNEEESEGERGEGVGRGRGKKKERKGREEGGGGGRRRGGRKGREEEGWGDGGAEHKMKVYMMKSQCM